MPTAITRHEVRKFMQEEGAVLIEVLPSQEYEDEHIAGAVNISLKQLNAGSTAGFDRDRPVVVY